MRERDPGLFIAGLMYYVILAVVVWALFDWLF